MLFMLPPKTIIHTAYRHEKYFSLTKELWTLIPPCRCSFSKLPHRETAPSSCLGSPWPTTLGMCLLWGELLENHTLCKASESEQFSTVFLLFIHCHFSPCVEGIVLHSLCIYLLFSFILQTLYFKNYYLPFYFFFPSSVVNAIHIFSFFYLWRDFYWPFSI